MKYVILVSHGLFAQGVHSVLKMVNGNTNDVLSIGLEDGMSAEKFAEKFKKLVSSISKSDSIILLGDLDGGSPLTTAINCLSELNLLENSLIFGGMNVGMAITACNLKDSITDSNEFVKTLLEESKDAITNIILNFNVTDDEI